MRLLALLLIFVALPAHAGVEQLTEKEFQKLSEDLAPKVNLFADAWAQDPTAEFYGGTTRDYLYWVKGKFKDAKTPEDAARIAAELRALPVIDVRGFIIGESDVDVFTEAKASLKAETYGIRKIDFQSPDTLNPETLLGQNERNQGFIPAEKIRLGKNGFTKSAELGDGLGEIYRGKLTVHFATPEQFATTKYAQEGLNHPVLLALRYLRLQAIDYYQSHGAGLPDKDLLLSAVDPASAKEVRAVIEGTLDGKTLVPYLAKPKFKSWINGAIQKAFRSYTNPTAAKELMHAFRVDELPNYYPKEIEPTNQYVFQKYRDPAKIRAALAAYHVDEAAFFRPVAEEFPDGKLYHGTKTEPAFRGILMQGVIGSEGGSAGKGLYGVRETSRHFAEQWGGDPQRLLYFPVKPEARIVDIRAGEGLRVLQAFEARHGKKDLEAFADAFGIDLLRYPYNAEAYVVKNSAVLGKAQGMYRQLLPLQDLLRLAEKISDPRAVVELGQVNNLRQEEITALIRHSGVSLPALRDTLLEKPAQAFLIEHYLPLPEFPGRNEILTRILGRENLDDQHAAVKFVFSHPELELGDENWRSLGRKTELAEDTLDHVLDYYRRGVGFGKEPLRADIRALLDEMLKVGSLDGYHSSVLFFDHIVSDPTFLPSWLDRQLTLKDTTKAISSAVLAVSREKERWLRRDDIVDKLLRLEGAAGALLNQLSGPTDFLEFPEILKKLADFPEVHSQLILHHFRRSGLRDAHPEILRKILHAGRADAMISNQLLEELSAEGEPVSAREILAAILGRETPDPVVIRTSDRFISKHPEFRPLWEKARDRVYENSPNLRDWLAHDREMTKLGQRPPSYFLAETAGRVLDPAFDQKGAVLQGRDRDELRSLAFEWIGAPAGSAREKALAAYLGHQPATAGNHEIAMLVLHPQVEGSPTLRDAALRYFENDLATVTTLRATSGADFATTLRVAAEDPDLSRRPFVREHLRNLIARLERDGRGSGVTARDVRSLLLKLETLPPIAATALPADCEARFRDLASFAKR